jgi:ribosome-binding factor A
MSAGKRSTKLAKQIQRDLPAIIDDVKRNSLPNALITITEVVVSGDLGIAKVYYTVIPSDKTSEVNEFLEVDNKAIRQQLAQVIRHQVRKVPELVFYLDDTLDRAQRIDDLLDKIKRGDA